MVCQVWWIFSFVYICLTVSVCARAHVCVCVCVRVCLHVSEHVHVRACSCMSITCDLCRSARSFTYVFAHVCVSVCIYARVFELTQSFNQLTCICHVEFSYMCYVAHVSRPNGSCRQSTRDV
jgi:hypothetical protein